MHFNPPSASFRISFIHVQGAERESTKLCHMLGSETDLKRDVQNWGFPLHKRTVQKLASFGWFYNDKAQISVLMKRDTDKWQNKIFKLVNNGRD